MTHRVLRKMRPEIGLLALLFLVVLGPSIIIPSVDAFAVHASSSTRCARTSSAGLWFPARIGVARRVKSVLRQQSSDESPSTKKKKKNAGDLDNNNDKTFNGRTTLALVGGQMLLVGAAMVAALIVGTPNLGFGSGIDFSLAALQWGFLFTVPLGLLAAALDLIEDQVPALKDVTKATQRSVLALMGGTFKPGLALLTAIALGLAAGFGEEMLFRGVMQYEIANRFGGAVTGVTLSSIVFGALHAVTPLYAVLATIASVYFGGLYLWSDNLAIPIACHTIYDIGALFYAHWTVCQLPLDEMKALAKWEGPDRPDVL